MKNPRFTTFLALIAFVLVATFVCAEQAKSVQQSSNDIKNKKADERISEELKQKLVSLNGDESNEAKDNYSGLKNGLNPNSNDNNDNNSKSVDEHGLTEADYDILADFIEYMTSNNQKLAEDKSSMKNDDTKNSDSSANDQKNQAKLNELLEQDYLLNEESDNKEQGYRINQDYKENKEDFESQGYEDHENDRALKEKDNQQLDDYGSFKNNDDALLDDQEIHGNEIKYDTAEYAVFGGNGKDQESMKKMARKQLNVDSIGDNLIERHEKWEESKSDGKKNMNSIEFNQLVSLDYADSDKKVNSDDTSNNKEKMSDVKDNKDPLNESSKDQELDLHPEDEQLSEKYGCSVCDNDASAPFSNLGYTDNKHPCDYDHDLKQLSDLNIEQSKHDNDDPYEYDDIDAL